MNNLYNDLVNLTLGENKTFFSSSFNFKDKVYKIFNYRLSSWNEFLLPNALNCRGTMFDVTNENNPILVSLSPEKFFNYEEGAVDHNTDKKIGVVMEKLDGSLISSFVCNDELFLKSKGSLYSSQAIDSNALIKTDKYKVLYNQLLNLCKLGYTVNMEYTAPHNRIVVPYQEEKLSILSIRRHLDGQNFFASSLTKEFDIKYPEIKNHLVAYRNSVFVTPEHFVTSSRDEQVGEGYVVEVINLVSNFSYLFKAKNTKYLALHHTKDSVNNSRRLFEAIIEESSDDLKSMFTDDPFTLNKIVSMENYVMPIYNNIIAKVDSFYNDNKNLDRKEYAVLARNTESDYMGLLMNKYLNKENDYKYFAKKHRQDIFKVEEIEAPNEEEVSNKIKMKM